MPYFLIAGGALALATLAYVLSPLWTTRRVATAGLVLGFAALSGLLYRSIGTPDALDPAHRSAPATLEEAIVRLEEQLAREPAQPEGWRLLARAYAQAGRATAARDAYARAVKLAPDPDVLAEAAEARALADPARRFDAQAVALLQRALTLDPAHQRARWFRGIAERQAGRPAEAARIWEPLLAQVDTKTAASLRPQIDAARQAAGLPALPAARVQGLTVKVDIDPALRAKLADGAALFVIARQVGGPPMPVAVERLPARFPATVTLDDGDSPMPTLRLSQLREVELLARVSFSGQAMPDAGDLQSAVRRSETTQRTPVALRIDTTVD